MGHPPRPGRAIFSLGCFLLLSVATVSANKCNVGCHGMHPSKSYQQGHTYVYDLEGVSTGSVASAQGDATLKLKATVELTAKPDCVRQLRVKNVQFNGVPANAPEIEQYAVQFNYHDGHIDTELCAEAGDSQESLNIKRAVVSLFQSAVFQDSGSTTHHETDIFGGCPTDFTFRKDGESLVVQKYRNLAQCAYRESINQGLVSANFDAAAGVKSSPLLASTQKVEQRFKHGILNKAASTETYKYRPFSNGDAGAKMTVETTLTLKGEKGDNPPAPVSQPKSLIFDAPHPVLKSSADAISHALKAAKAAVAGGVKAEAAEKFAELVKVLRGSNKNDILSVYQKVRAGAGFDKVADQKIFLDALFRAGSGEAAEVAVELIKNRDISGIQSLLFYASLPLIGHVHLPSVAAVTTLLDQPNLPRIGYLGVGQVIGKYCQQHSCENVPEVKNAVHKIREKVGNGKTKTREQENNVISALKALGNARYLDDATLAKLANIASDKNVRNRVRVAAIEALPTRCSMKWKNILMKILGDREEDSEIRIKSYLSLVSCACPHVANNLKQVLDKETVNQVGSFIQTHLRNLRASTDPNKQEAKRQLGLIKPRKFPEDFRKFSFNNELSYSIDAFGAGAAVESNVIYSQNSFVPRSADLNVTVELFGRNLNLFELNSRVENLDRLIEHYLGPKGTIGKHYFEDTPEESLNIFFKFMDDVDKRFRKTIRGKREVKQGELDRFAKNVHLRGTEVDEDLDLDLSMKLFGVELAYLSYQGDTNKITPKYIIDKLFDGLDKGFDAAKSFHYDLEHHLQFLDASIVYPTGLGTALNLGVSGTSVVHLKTNGKIDIPAIIRDPKNAALRIALEPSVSVRIDGKIVVEGFGIESGIKLLGTLHTATASDISVTVLNGNGVDINFGLPKKKQELMTVTSEVLLTSGPKGEKLVAPKFTKGKEFSDCFDQFSALLGLGICGHVSFPYDSMESVQEKPFYPLSGPAKISIILENNDVSSYHLKVHYNEISPKAGVFEILLDTPNSKTNRHVSLKVEGGSEPDRYLKVSLDSPIKKASAEIALKNNAQEKGLLVRLLNDQMEYYVRLGVLANGSKYKPVLEYKIPEHIERLAGTKSGTKGGPQQQYNLQGSVDVSDFEGGQKFVFDSVALVGNGQKLASLDGSVVATPNMINVDTNLGFVDENVALKLSGKRLEQDHYTLLLSAMPSRDANIGFTFNCEIKRTPQSLDNVFVFVHGPDPNSEINRLTYEQHYTGKSDTPSFMLSGSEKLTYPAMKILGKIEGELTKKSISFDVEVKYDKFKFGTELDVKVDKEKPGDYEIEFEADILENSIELKSKRTIIDNHRSKFKNSLELTPGGKYDADGTVTYEVTKNNINVQVDGDVNLNGKKVKLDTGLEANPQVLNSRAFVTIDSVKYIEFVLKTKRTPNPVGNLNLNLKNYLTANGQFAFQNGKGNGHLNVDIPKINRKIKAKGDLAVSGSEHVANLEVLYDADKDPNKRIKLSTISDITKNSIDTKNIIEIAPHKMEINAKGKCQGTFNDGQQNLDLDLTLPDGRFLVYKMKRNSVKKENNKIDAHVQTELIDYEKKGGASRKLSYNADAKDVDLKTSNMKTNGELKFVNFDGKDLVAAWQLKNQVEGKDSQDAELVLNVYGAYMPKKFQFEIGANYDKTDGTLKGKTSLGNDLMVKGSYTYAEKGKLSKIDSMFEAKFPSDKLRNLKFDTSQSMQDLDEEGDALDYVGSAALTYNDDKTLKAEISLKTLGLPDADRKGELAGKLTLTILKAPPLTIGGGYSFDPTGDKKKASQTVNVNYGDMEATVVANTEYLPDLSYVSMNAKSTLPFEKMRKVDVQVTHKREKDGKNRDTDIAITADGAKYTLKSEIQEDDLGFLLHILMTCPNGKTELLSKFQKLGENEYTGEWKIDTMKGFVVADARVNLESVDNFVINANFDSNTIKTRKIHAEIANKPTAKTGRRIIITVTSEGQNIVTGSTNYKRRDEDGKIVVEGNGNLKIGENTRSSSFKYTRQHLSQATDGEVGVAMVLNANFGPSAIVGELKLSDKEIHVFNSYCEQNKDCAHFKLQSILASDQKTHFKHQITVEVDLKKFNVPAEFGLKTSTEYKDFIFDHAASLYLHSSKDKSEYTYQVYVHPKDSAIIMTLPSRELAVVATFDMPKTRQTGAYRFDLSLYLDRKNKPSDKTSVSASGDLNVDKNSLSLSGETKFTYPSQPKDMVVKGRLHYGGEHLLDANLDIDVFAKKSQKISIVAKLQQETIPNGYNATSIIEVNSRGQQLKVDLKSHLAISSKEIGFGTIFSYTDVHQKPKSVAALFSADFSRVYLLVTSPSKDLIKSESNIEFTKNLQKVDTELSVGGGKPVVVNFEANDLNSFKYLSYSKENPNNKLTANGRVVIGQLAEVHADAYKDGAKKSLFHLLVHLDEGKFLKPDFGYSKENIIAVIEYTRGRMIDLLKKLQDVSIGIGEEVQTELKDLLEHLRKAQPNLKPLLDYYQTELNKLKNELHADETVKEIQATLNKHFGAIIIAVTDTMKQVAERLNELQKQYYEILSKLTDVVKSVYPQLKASYDKLFQAIIKVLDAGANLAVTYLTAILNLINEHQVELKEVTAVISEITQDIAKIIFKAYGQIKEDVEEFVVLLVQQIKALPVYEIAKDKYQNLANFEVPEGLLSPMEEICNHISAIMPTRELYDFSDLTCKYIFKHARRQKVDETAEIKKIYTHAISAVQSILALLQSQATVDNLFSLLEAQTPVDFSMLSSLPGIATLKVSVLNLLRSNELPSPLDLYYTYKPSCYVNDIVPPFSKVGTVMDGGHFFTFDGQHFVMPGTCNYILAQDIQDGNFSVVANFNKGNLISVTITEPSESMTLKANGNILVNNKPGDYPANTKNLHAFLTQPTANVKSNYGVHVACTMKPPMYCTVRVSGFYLGKLRGLLGDGNNEPYDDFTLPSGKITENPGDFGNAYKLKPDCQGATAVDKSKVPRAQICTDYFASSSSPMRSCFNQVQKDHFRDACDVAVAQNENAPCLIASLYLGSCCEKGIHGVSIPTTCACQKENGGASDDTFSVKVPNNKADIIFVVEQDVENEKVFKDMITPLMSELRDELKQHGITDVHIGLIGFGDKMKWPQHYTFNGDTNIHGEVKNMKFEEKEPIIQLKEARSGDVEKAMTYLGQRLDVEFSTFQLTDAYEEAIRYPFRPGAAKAVVGVVTTLCEKSPFPISLQQLRLLLGQKLYRDLGLTYYHVSYPNELLVSGKPQKNIVGYDDESVYTFSDSKKKPLSGSSDLKNNLAVSTADVCADFAVSSGGAAFSADNFLEAKPNQKKQFVQVAARKIVDDLTSVEIEQECSCDRSCPNARTTCKVVDRREKEPLARHTKGGVKG